MRKDVLETLECLVLSNCFASHPRASSESLVKSAAGCLAMRHSFLDLGLRQIKVIQDDHHRLTHDVS